MTRARRQSLLRRRLRGLVVAVLVFGSLYGVTLFLPWMFFSWARDGVFIRVRSDEPIPEPAAAVVRLAEARIQRSPLFDAKRVYSVYVCNTEWRWNYFSGFDRRSRAFATSLGRAVYMRKARWEANRLLGPDGAEGQRPLDAYIAHEVTHGMVEDHLGSVSVRRLPIWVREGYAEYVARRDTFDYEQTRARLLAGDEDLVTRRRDPYLKYLLLVAHLLDREGWRLDTLLNEPPSPTAVEARVRRRP